MTPPDKATAARAFAQYAHNPVARHWKVVWKIVAHLKAAEDLGVVPAGTGLKLWFADADYAYKAVGFGCHGRARKYSGVQVARCSIA